MKVSDFKKYSGMALVIGAIVLVMSIVCFVVVGTILGNIENTLGYKLTASEAKERIAQAEMIAPMLGSDVSDMLGVSSFQIFLIKLTISMRIPLLVVGILLLSAGVALRFVNVDSETMDRAKTEIAHGISSASTALKETIDKATSKCPKCGKVCSAKTVFCPSCGERTVKPETVARSVKISAKSTYTCPNCKKVYSEKIAFCSACGQKIPDEAPKDIRCSNCGAVNSAGARFCSACGNDLKARVFDNISQPDAVSTAPKEKTISVKDEGAPAPIVHTHVHVEPAKPTIEVVPEKKNPFMGNPKKL